MNEKGIPGRGNSRSKDRKGSVCERELSMAGTRRGRAKRSRQKTQWLLAGDAVRLIVPSSVAGARAHTDALRTDLGALCIWTLGFFVTVLQ